jgi:arginyl-tRNA--protein-N-Asp/Glu arginylyltransferase
MPEINPEPSSATFSFWPAIPPPANLRLTVLAPHPCSYIQGRTAQSRAIWTDRLPGELYHVMMDSGFRRSGKLIYQPMCAGCRACQALRVAVATFLPSKSQKRCLRRNADLTMEVGLPTPTSEKHELYRRYVREWHGAAAEDDYDHFVSFLYDSPVETREFTYRDREGRLLAVGICDVSSGSLSTVYFYFDPYESHRGLGTYGALREISFARERRIAYYYLGYWIDGCRSMDYKSAFRPYEILWPDGVWRSASVTGSCAAKRI